jgi:hypothetical protein
MRPPFIPYRAFCTLAGAELSREADLYLARADVVAVVLCADEPGKRNALLVVGDGQVCKRIEEVAEHAPEGLIPFCAVRAEEKAFADNQTGAGDELVQREQALIERERAVAELERKNAELEARVNAAVRSFRRK